MGRWARRLLAGDELEHAVADGHFDIGWDDVDVVGLDSGVIFDFRDGQDGGRGPGSQGQFRDWGRDVERGRRPCRYRVEVMISSCVNASRPPADAPIPMTMGTSGRRLMAAPWVLPVGTFFIF